MFLTELSPLVQELVHQPISFLGGFCSGMLRLNLSDDPVRSWLDQQTGTAAYSTPSHRHNGNGNGSGPQSISID
jgi:hypothetical protein